MTSVIIIEQFIKNEGAVVSSSCQFLYYKNLDLITICTLVYVRSSTLFSPRFPHRGLPNGLWLNPLRALMLMRANKLNYLSKANAVGLRHSFC